MANKPMTTKQALDLLQKHAAFTPKQSDMLELDAVLTHFSQMAADLEREQGVREDAQRQLRDMRAELSRCRSLLVREARCRRNLQQQMRQTLMKDIPDGR